jgi:hypothetical protein
MKARYAYPLVFFLPAAMAVAVAGALLAVACAGVLWIFVYGDNPWPPLAGMLVMWGATAAALLMLCGLLAIAHRVGKAREAHGGLTRSHLMVALGLSVALPLLVFLQQWQVGNLGHNRVPPNNSSKPAPLRGTA